MTEGRKGGGHYGHRAARANLRAGRYEVFDERARRGYDGSKSGPRGHTGGSTSMHIPNAVLDPKVAVATGAIGALGLTFGLRALEKRLGERTTVLTGTMAAFVFAAQMVNFPLGPLGISGHLLGGVLAAVMLGPWGGAVVIAAVLIVQCFLFGDGGLTALGANFVNMGLIGAVVGHAIYAPIRRAIGGHAGIILGAMIAAWFSVLLAAGAFSIELAGSGRRGEFLRVLSWMTLVHAGIGVGEAIITGLVLRFLLLTRPDLIDEPDPADLEGPTAAGRVKGWLRIALAGLGVALAVGIFLAPFASESPDGLEFVGERTGFLKGEPPATLPVPIPDYALPGLAELSLKGATAAAGVVGTLVVFGVGVVLSSLVGRAVAARSDPSEVSPDAA
jgi:cobalt/nickel transport system permease protein